MAPMQYGTSTEERAKAAAEDPTEAEADHCLAEREARTAQHDARAAMVSGTNRVSMMEA